MFSTFYLSPDLYIYAPLEKVPDSIHAEAKAAFMHSNKNKSFTDPVVALNVFYGSYELDRRTRCFKILLRIPVNYYGASSPSK